MSLILDLQENIYKQIKNNYYEAGRHVVGFWDLSIDVFLEVQNNRCSQIVCLIYYIVYGILRWYTI